MFHLNLKIITDILHEDQYTYLITSRSFLFRKINISEKVIEKIKSHIFRFNNSFFFENHAVCEIMWKKYCAA